MIAIKPRSSNAYHSAAAKARSMMRKAVRAGIIAKGTICNECKRNDALMHAHHNDYTKPYSIEWLCPTCHGKRPKRKRMMVVDLGAWPHNHVVIDAVIEHRELPI